MDRELLKMRFNNILCNEEQAETALDAVQFAAMQTRGPVVPIEDAYCYYLAKGKSHYTPEGLASVCLHVEQMRAFGLDISLVDGICQGPVR